MSMRDENLKVNLLNEFTESEKNTCAYDKLAGESRLSNFGIYTLSSKLYNYEEDDYRNSQSSLLEVVDEDEE